MEPRLEIKLQDASPKCATCAHFGGGTAGQCSLFQFHVLDLAVCSSWTLEISVRNDGEHQGHFSDAIAGLGLQKAEQ